MFDRLKVFTLLLLTTAVVSARDLKENFSVKPINEGWFIGAGVGTQFYVGEADHLQPVGYRFSTAMEGNVGKWITKSLALRFQGNAARVTGGNLKGKKDVMNLINFHMDLMVDCFNFFGGVDENRKFTIMPLIGFGGAKSNYASCFTFDLGAEALYRVNPHISFFGELKGILLNDKMDGFAGGFKGEGSAFLTAGFYYTF